jgi:ABC-type taurine transport system substrate-binding protein
MQSSSFDAVRGVWTRRRALQAAGVGAAALSMPGLVHAQAQRLRFGNQPVINFAPFSIPLAMQRYAGKVDVATTVFDSGPLVVQAMMGGSIDCGLVGVPPIVNAASAGLPIRVISAINNPSRGYSLIAGPQYKTVKDLAGKKVATASGTALQYFLERALAKYGMTAKDIDFQDMQIEQARSAYVAGQVEAIVPRETDRLAVLRERAGSKVLLDADGFTKGEGSLEPFLAFDVCIATVDAIKRLGPGMTAMLGVYHREIAPMLNNPATRPQALTQVTAWLRSVGNAKAQDDAVAAQLGYTEFLDLAKTRQVMAEQLKKAFTTNAEYLVRIGRFPKVPDFGPIIDSSLLPAA